MRQLSTRRRGPITVALAVAAALYLIVGCTPSASKAGTINPMNRPTTIPGFTNGQLPESLLYTVSSQCRIHRPAAGPLIAMIEHAARDGVRLTPVDCYRDYAGQVYWRNFWCGRGICANAATPGYSNHGWGKAVDFGGTTWTSADYRWLTAHAHEYGFNRPVMVNEAWHWEWVGDGGTLRAAPVRQDLWTR